MTDSRKNISRFRFGTYKIFKLNGHLYACFCMSLEFPFSYVMFFSFVCSVLGYLRSDVTLEIFVLTETRQSS